LITDLQFPRPSRPSHCHTCIDACLTVISNSPISFESEDILSSPKRHTLLLAYLAATCIGLYYYLVDKPDPTQPQTAQETQPQPAHISTEPIPPLPLALALDQRKVELGQRLFHEAKLSGDGTISCASCHNLASGGVDRLPFARGIGGQEGAINVPTVFNSGLNFSQFWDGRAETLEDQVDGPLQSATEMAGSWPKAIAMLAKDASYGSEFAAIYPDGIQTKNIKDAIATFERSLVTPNSRFDRFLRGEQTALGENEREGYLLFKRIGCISCHQGMNMGGNIYQKLGIMEDYFAARGHINAADFGRFNVTRHEEDQFFFKVPSLRNVALTAPYLHDGTAKTLNEAVRVMARYQLGVKLQESEEAAIVAFLGTLTGEYQGKLLQ
jgi:cytochrome c peroxidase